MKIKLLLLAIMSIFQINNSQLSAQTAGNSKKILVVYFSWSSSGNTRNMAQQIKEAAGADIFEIVPVKSYPRDYQACVDQAKDEINRKFKPEIKGKVPNFDSYDIIFVGSPNWWSTIAPPVATFLTTHNLKGKTILPFMTHEGTHLGRSVKDIQELCPDATVFPSLPVRGGSVKNAGNDIQKWLKDNKVIN
ncbi:MAG: flavodoxin [Dysgonomonas sp.]|nr:flavodoxin [Dysgonomonas sp.]